MVKTNHCESDCKSCLTGGVTLPPTQWAAQAKGETSDDTFADADNAGDSL